MADDAVQRVAGLQATEWNELPSATTRCYTSPRLLSQCAKQLEHRKTTIHQEDQLTF